MNISLELEIKDFDVPNVVMENCNERMRVVRLNELNLKTLSKLCDDFRASVFKKAGKVDFRDNPSDNEWILASYDSDKDTTLKFEDLPPVTSEEAEQALNEAYEKITNHPAAQPPPVTKSSKDLMDILPAIGETFNMMIACVMVSVRRYAPIEDSEDLRVRILKTDFDIARGHTVDISFHNMIATMRVGYCILHDFDIEVGMVIIS